jgi:hypothetical protein
MPRKGLCSFRGRAIHLAADEIVRVVGAHRTAKNDGGCVFTHGLRQRIAEPWPPHVEPIAELLQGGTDTAGCRMFLMQDGQDR